MKFRVAATSALGTCKDGTGPRHGDPARVEVIAGRKWVSLSSGGRVEEKRQRGAG